MALINCPECKKEISDRAVSCPNCGMPITVSSASIKPPSHNAAVCGKCGQTDRLTRMGALQLNQRKFNIETSEVELKTNGYSISGQFALTDDFSIVSSPWVGLGANSSQTSGTIQTDGTSVTALLNLVESFIPTFLPGDPLPEDFQSQISKFEDVMICERCACPTVEGVPIKFEELCLSVFGPSGLVRAIEYKRLANSGATATYGVSVRRKGRENLDRPSTKKLFDSLIPEVNFNSNATEEIVVGETSVWIAIGTTGSQTKAKMSGVFGKPSWWPTTTSISAMFDSSSNSALFSIVATGDFVNSALTDIGIPSSYKKRFKELAGVLDSNI